MRIVVFSKAPVPGQVKTRLAPRLGAAGAAELHRRLVRRTLACAVAADIGPVVLSASPNAGHGFFADCRDEFGVALDDQREGDLGERMARAFERHAPAILVGSDCPILDPAGLRAAARALDDHDAVFGPTEDGGYFLVALREPRRALFEGIAWSTSQVMRRTRAIAARLALSLHELPLAWDVDRPADLDRLAHALDDGAQLLADLPA